MTDASSDAVLSPSTVATSPANVGGECSAARPVVGGLPSPSGAENTHVQGADLAAENHGASGDYHVHRVGEFEVRTASDLADRLSYAVTSQPLRWIDCYGDPTPHYQHGFHGGCAICAAGDAPSALRVVIDAVLEAAAGETLVREASGG